MSARANFTPQAEQDLLDQAVYLAENASLETSDRFLDAAGQTADKLAGMPEMGKTWDGIHEETREAIRLWSVYDFPKILIFYRIESTGIVVLRVLHGARDFPPLLEELQ